MFWKNQWPFGRDHDDSTVRFQPLVFEGLGNLSFCVTPCRNVLPHHLFHMRSLQTSLNNYGHLWTIEASEKSHLSPKQEWSLIHTPLGSSYGMFTYNYHTWILITHNKKVGTAWLSRLETAPPKWVSLQKNKKTPLGDTSSGPLGLLKLHWLSLQKKTCTIAREPFLFLNIVCGNLFLETIKTHISPKTYTIHVVNNIVWSTNILENVRLLIKQHCRHFLTAGVFSSNNRPASTSLAATWVQWGKKTN